MKLFKYLLDVLCNLVIGGFLFLIFICNSSSATASTSSMSEAQARSCVFTPLETGITTEKEMKCTLSYKKPRLISNQKFGSNVIKVYSYRNARFEYTSLIFKNGILSSISVRGGTNASI
jgi:hypothetical protein